MKLKTDEPKAADKMSRDERIAEVGRILARGFLRLKDSEARKKAQKSEFPALSSPAQRGSL
ncbi:MAG: hypothetical protein AAFN77_15765 [Planctomycetota bacterium]